MHTINRHPSRWMTEDLEIFRASVRRLIEREFVPHIDKWTEQGVVDREAWELAGDSGLLCASIPEQWGGAGGSFAHEAIISEELEYSGVGFGFSIPLHNAIVAPYILHHGTDDQRQRWLPGMASGKIVGAVAMTEPGTGSDLQAVRIRAERTDAGYRITGQKTFITNGQLADLVITVCKTDPTLGGRGISLIAVEGDRPGFRKGRNLAKIGLKMSDTSELFYDGVEVPAENLIGGVEGRGFAMLMSELPQERLVIAACAVAAIERALALTLDYVQERTAFGQRIIDFQNTAFTLAECKTEAAVARAFLDDCIERHLAGQLDTSTASMAKFWCTDRQCSIIDRCLQLFGGYGYMAEYPISRMYTDARVQKIYGGTNEIMKLVISRELLGDA
jgi:acyl-CoA dehydrogenase